jgi:hypothetical protein
MSVNIYVNIPKVGVNYMSKIIKIVLVTAMTTSLFLSAATTALPSGTTADQMR